MFFSALLFGPELQSNRSARHVGCIDPVCDLRSVVLDAYENAKFLCDQYYLASPDVQVHEHGGSLSICVRKPEPENRNRMRSAVRLEPV